MNAKEMPYNAKVILIKLIHEDNNCGGEIEHTGEKKVQNTKDPETEEVVALPMFAHVCTKCGQQQWAPAIYPKLDFQTTTLLLEEPPPSKILHPYN